MVRVASRGKARSLELLTALSSLGRKCTTLNIHHFPREHRTSIFLPSKQHIACISRVVHHAVSHIQLADSRMHIYILHTFRLMSLLQTHSRHLEEVFDYLRTRLFSFLSQFLSTGVIWQRQAFKRTCTRP